MFRDADDAFVHTCVHSCRRGLHWLLTKRFLRVKSARSRQVSPWVDEYPAVRVQSRHAARSLCTRRSRTDARRAALDVARRLARHPAARRHATKPFSRPAPDCRFADRSSCHSESRLAATSSAADGSCSCRWPAHLLHPEAAAVATAGAGEPRGGFYVDSRSVRATNSPVVSGGGLLQA